MQQENAVRAALEADRVTVGAAAETGSPIMVEILGSLGLDWVYVDFEHKNPSPLDSHYLEGLTRAAECADTELIVRLPTGEPFLVRKVLDAGIRNLVVPRVKTRADVEEAVRAAHFEYDGEPGERGLSQGRSSAYGATYSKRAGDTYHVVEDENVLVGALLEHREALENLDDILSVEGLDFVFPGPGDLGVSLGHTLEYGNEEVQAGIERIRAAAVERGLPLKGVHGSHFEGRDGARAAVEDGYRLIGLGNDFRAARAVIGERRDWLDDIA